MKNQIDIYNERMERIGTATREEAHREGHWHKAFHCWVVAERGDGKGSLLFQRRSESKDIGANTLDISAAGHLDAGEEPVAGLRELEEELGLVVSPENLRALGIHVEVYCDTNVVNREFDHVYLIRDDRALQDYRVQASEVSGLAEVDLDDGIALFTRQADSIRATSLMFDKLGAPAGDPFTDRLGIDAFLGGERNNYFIKVLLLAKRFLAGDENLYI